MNNKASKSAQIKFTLPDWLTVLPFENPVISHAVDCAKRGNVKKSPYFADLTGTDDVFEFVPHNDLFYRVLNEVTGENFTTQGDIVAYIASVAQMRGEYEKFRGAIAQMEQSGYGIVQPSFESFTLAEPQSYRSGKNHGIKLRATGQSIHLLRVDVNCEVTPIIGEQAQSNEMLKYLQSEYKTNPAAVWQTPIFGKSLESIVREDIANKANSMPNLAKGKMQKTIAKIVNNGKGGVICILL
jgi:stage IV sporulation protein A